MHSNSIFDDESVLLCRQLVHDRPSHEILTGSGLAWYSALNDTAEASRCILTRPVLIFCSHDALGTMLLQVLKSFAHQL